MTSTAVHPRIRTQGGTIAAARTDIPGLENRTFVGRSPEAGGAVNPTSRFPPPTDPAKLPQTHGHAEQDIADQLDAELSGIPKEQLEGRRVWILVEQEPCNTCAQGLKGPADARGVLRKLSEEYPEITFEVKNLTSSSHIILKNGQLADTARATATTAPEATQALTDTHAGSPMDAHKGSPMDVHEGSPMDVHKGSPMAKPAPELKLQTGPSVIEDLPALEGGMARSLGRLAVDELKGLFVTAILLGLVDLAFAWITYTPGGESYEEKELRELFERKVQPGVGTAISTQAREATKMYLSRPDLPIYANITVDLEESWTESGIVGAESGKKINDASFVRLDVGFERISGEKIIKKEKDVSLTGDVNTYYATKRVTYAVELQFETPAQRQYRISLKDAGKLARQGLSARIAANIHFPDDLSLADAAEEKQRKTFCQPSLRQERERERRKLWVQAYIDYTAWNGPAKLYTDAQSYLSELEQQRPPSSCTEALSQGDTQNMLVPAQETETDRMVRILSRP